MLPQTEFRVKKPLQFILYNMLNSDTIKNFQKIFCHKKEKKNQLTHKETSKHSSSKQRESSVEKRIKKNRGVPNTRLVFPQFHDFGPDVIRLENHDLKLVSLFQTKQSTKP